MTKTLLVGSAAKSSSYDLLNADRNSDEFTNTVFSFSNSFSLLQSAANITAPGREENTAFLIGGEDLRLAVDLYTDLIERMPEERKFSVMLDPNGSITYAATIMAILFHYEESLDSKQVIIIGGGRVGGVLATMVTLSRGFANLASPSNVELDHAGTLVQRFGADTRFSKERTETPLTSGSYEFIVSTATPGLNIGTLQQCKDRGAKIVIESSPLPPAGILGIEMKKNGIFLGPVEIHKIAQELIPSLIRENLT